jgi:hypothetical protein
VRLSALRENVRTALKNLQGTKTRAYLSAAQKIKSFITSWQGVLHVSRNEGTKYRLNIDE